MKITNVSHYVSVSGKELCAENIHFIIEGAKFEALASAGDSLALRHYKNWLKSAEVKKPSHNKQSTQNYACPKCGAVLSVNEYRTGECHSCRSTISA